MNRTTVATFIVFYAAPVVAVVGLSVWHILKERRAWKRDHDEKVRVFEFWNARCDEALSAYINAQPEQKEAKWLAFKQTMRRYEQEVLEPLARRRL
jgi:hypothetical protein